MMLKKAFLATVDLFSTAIPLPVLKTISGQTTLLPFYHLVSDQVVPHVKHLYRIRNKNQFIQDLDYLLKHYKALHLDQFKDSLHNGKKLPKNSFLLSFDDGLAECYHVIAPILKKKGIPASFFLNSAFIDNKALMFRYKASLLIEHIFQDLDKRTLITQQLFREHQIPYSNFSLDLKKITWKQQAFLDVLAQALSLDFQQYLDKQQPYLSVKQIHEMQQDGFSFGSHSIDHPRYKNIAKSEQIKQTLDGHLQLKNSLDHIDTIFAFPFTDDAVGLSFFEALYQSNTIDYSFGGAGIKHEKNRQHWQRLGLESSGIRSSKQIIHSEYCYYLLKSIFRKNTIRRH